MKKYEIEIVGTTPVIWNVMKRELEMEKKKAKKNELEAWEEKNWLRKAEYDKKGRAVIPIRWLKAMLINAAKGTRIVPHFESTKRATYTRYMESTMIDTVEAVAKKKDLEYYGKYMGSRGGRGGTKVWRIRPMMKRWKTKFTFVDPHGKMLKRELKEILEWGGAFIGLGDSRNQNFGRFEVKSIKEVAK
jgi:hypothetical protein